MSFLKNIFKSNKNSELSNSRKSELESLANQVLSDTDDLLEELDSQQNQLDKLSPEELAWAEWFHTLSETRKKVVEMGAANGVAVNAGNIDLVIKTLLEQQLANEDSQ